MNTAGNVVVIRPITADDIASFRDCVDAVCREQQYLAFLEAPPPAMVREFVLKNIRTGNPQLVAVQGDRVIGWCDICRMDKPVYAHVGVLGLGLAKAFRGQGIGRQLILATLERARAAGFERVELTVYATNRRAQQLYASVGFETEGIKRKARKLDGVYDDALMMAKLFV